MWNPTTRRRYETDLTDAEWAMIAPLLPQPAPRCVSQPGRFGRSSTPFFTFCGAGFPGVSSRKTCRPRARSSGISAAGVTPMSLRGSITASSWRIVNGPAARPLQVLLCWIGRVSTPPSAADRVDMMRVKDHSRKRQAMDDMDGRTLVLAPQAADVQDRDGAIPVLRLSRTSFPFVAKAFAHMGYLATGRKMRRLSTSR